ncbi:MAG: right-handed parallel beta-helix repeat-containing protein [Myxococcales bacterium]|nr:right-handed parallel beta-helix repeat-containing protein [Myxococcales bacterium]
MARRVWVGVASLGCVLSFGSAAFATDFYVDPVNGSPSGDGSQGNPWRTLQEVVEADLIASQNWDTLPYDTGSRLEPKNPGAPIQAGDTIWLLSGYHGAVEITGYYNASDITIAAAPGASPQLASLLIRSAKNWVVRGLSLSPDYAPTYERTTMIDLDSHGYSGPVSDVTVEDCQLQSVADASSWTANDWDTRAVNGIGADGSNITIRGNRLKNVNFGISVGASDSLVEDNVVDSFSGDGMRGLGDHSTFQYNLVKNCYDVNDNHDDGFQSWSSGPGGVGTGEVTGMVLRGNVIINYEDPNQPLRGPLQGIGCFDGTFVDWVVENNVIITDHWHGISLYGARNSRIVNNTVLDPNTSDPGPPWIKIENHKDGTAPVDCLVANNLTTALANAGGVTEDHNLLIDDPLKLFVDPAAYDVHLLDDSPAIDQGTSDHAPSHDIEGIPRPQGSAVDVGAYEWHDPSVMPDPDAGVSGGSGGGPGGSSSGGTAQGGGNQGGSANAGGGQGGAASGGDSSGGGSAASADSSDDSGCGCRVGAGSSDSSLLLLALGLGAGLMARRRRRRQAARG